MGLAFLGYTVNDFHDLTFGWRDNAYGSIFYTIVGLHALHVVIGLCMNGLVQIKAWQGKFTADRHTTRRGLRPVLALRRRRVDLRVRLPVPVRGPPVTERRRSSDIESASAAPPRRQRVVRRLRRAGRVDRPPDVPGLGRALDPHRPPVELDAGRRHRGDRAGHRGRPAAGLAAGPGGRGRGEPMDSDDAGQLHFLGQVGLLVGAINLALILLEGSYVLSIPQLTGKLTRLIIADPGRAGRRRRRGRRPTGRAPPGGGGRAAAPWSSPVQAGFFAAGLVAVAVALASPLDTWADRSLSAHMVQHVLLLSRRRAPPGPGRAAPHAAVGAARTRGRRRALSLRRRLLAHHDRHFTMWVVGHPRRPGRGHVGDGTCPPPTRPPCAIRRSMPSSM